MSASRVSACKKTIVHFDTGIYDVDAVKDAVKEFGARAKLLKSVKKAPIRVEVSAPDPAADELSSLALLRTIEERRK